MGEGLSRFLSVQQRVTNGFGRIPPTNYGVATMWLNNTPRQNFVNTALDDNNPDPVTACATLYIYYLYDQLGYTIDEIVNAGGPTLNDVYRNLKGGGDGWTPFINLVNTYYPPNNTYNPVGDSVFPVADLSDFWAPNQITCGYQQNGTLFINHTTRAEVIVSLSSSDTAIATVPATVTLTPGVTSITVPVQAVALPIPFTPPKQVEITAEYAGRSVTMTADVVPPTVDSITLSPNTVTAGGTATGTVTLNRPSLNGSVDVDLTTGSPGWVVLPSQLSIPQGQDTGTFTLTTHPALIPFPTVHASITASYAGANVSATLTINPTVIAGIVESLTLYPSAVVGGAPSHGTVTLQQAVPTATVVGLAAIPFGSVFVPASGSSPATVPATITIAAGQINGSFNIDTGPLNPPINRRTVSIMAAAVVEKYAMLTITS
jgi:hypothetical protein